VIADAAAETIGVAAVLSYTHPLQTALEESSCRMLEKIDLLWEGGLSGTSKCYGV
jgi:hypothetical protein